MPTADANHAGEAPAAEMLSRWALDGPFAVAIGLVVTLQVATWLPHYLTWPYWADHDVFATAARAWTRGRVPYAETLGNNFPGTIYLFLGLGVLFGWGRPGPWYALDAGLTLALGLTLVHWSGRRFGARAPGLAGFLALTSYLLGLDYSHAAQRDGQGPILGCLAILVVQARPGRGARLLAGGLAALAIAIRPQTLLLWPGLALAVVADRGDARPCRALGEVAAALGIGLAALFAPLAAAGALDDFARGVGLATYGGAYNRATPAGVLKSWFLQLSALRWWALPAAVALLGSPFAGRDGAAAPPWLAAFAGTTLYKPLSPMAHSYLEIPLEVVGAVLVALLVGLLLGRKSLPASSRLAGACLALGLGTTTARPEFCVAGPTARALVAFGRGAAPSETPPGYRRGRVPTSAYYAWEDYRAALDYLRNRTTPTTPVANALKGDPAVNAMIDRPSPFPAESVAWLRMVRPDDEPRFVDALRAATDALIVWSPGEPGPDPSRRLDLLTDTIEELFEPEARFGVIEVWRRRPGR